jgi:hypothetical protein
MMPQSATWHAAGSRVGECRPDGRLAAVNQYGFWLDTMTFPSRTMHERGFSMKLIWWITYNENAVQDQPYPPLHNCRRATAGCAVA